MAALGNIGNAMPRPKQISSASLFGVQNNATGVTGLTATSEVPGSVALLLRNGILYDRTYADASTGVWSFYSGDNSGSQTYTIVTMTQAGGATGEVWRASITAGVATVTKIFSASRAFGFASA